MKIKLIKMNKNKDYSNTCPNNILINKIINKTILINLM
jgi:hypothetical protein